MVSGAKRSRTRKYDQKVEASEGFRLPLTSCTYDQTATAADNLKHVAKEKRTTYRSATDVPRAVHARTYLWNDGIAESDHVHSFLQHLIGEV